MSAFDWALMALVAAWPALILFCILQMVWAWAVDWWHRHRGDEWSEYRPTVDELSTYPDEVLHRMQMEASGQYGKTWAKRKVIAAQRKRTLQAAWDRAALTDE